MATTLEVLQALGGGNPGKDIRDLFADVEAPSVTSIMEGLANMRRPAGTALGAGGEVISVPQGRMVVDPFRGTITPLERELQVELAQEEFQRGAEAAVGNNLADLLSIGLPRRDFAKEAIANALLPSAAGTPSAVPSVTIPTGPMPRRADFLAEEPVPDERDFSKVIEMFEATRPEETEPRGFLQNALMALAMGAGTAQGDTLGQVIGGFGGGVGQAAVNLIQQEEAREKAEKSDLREFLRDRAAIELDVAEAKDARKRERDAVRFRNEQNRLNAEFEDLVNGRSRVNVDPRTGMVTIERGDEVEIQFNPQIMGALRMARGLGGRSESEDRASSRARDLFPAASPEAQAVMDGLFDVSSLLAQDIVPDSPTGQAFATITGVNLEELRQVALMQAQSMGFTGKELGAQVVASLENQIFLAMASAANRDPALVQELIKTLR